MKKLLTSVMVAMCALLLAWPAMAERGEKQGQPGQGEAVADGQGPKQEQDNLHREPEAAKRQKEFRQKREDMKQRRDAAQELRARNIANDDPGQAVIETPAARH